MSVTGHIIGNWNLTGEVNDSGGTNVVPNPPEEATDTLEKVGIDDVVYSITGEQEQADWDQADPTAVDYIKNKPTIPAAQVNSDWDAESGVAEILNKPTLSAVATSGSYTDLTDTPTIPAAQVNSDWDAASGVAQILNKPTIPAAQVNSDWDAASGVAQILNKPTLSAVATSGDASDVSYDNTLSGMTATDVQDAVDELKSNLTDLTGFINGSSYITQTADRAVLNYTATQDCWINITVNATGIEIKIDNGTLPVATLSGSSSALSSIMLPLKTGQTITSSSAIRIANVFPML